MKTPVLLAVAAGCLVSFGETYEGSGYLSVSDPNWFGAYTSITFGEGCLDYSGGDVTTAVPLAFKPAGTRKISTLKVADGTTLTLTGNEKVLTAGGLVKTGTGRLSLERASVSFNNGTAVAAGTAPAAAAWDANGVMTSGWAVKGLNVHEGEVQVKGAAVDFGDTLRVGAMGSANGSTLRLEGARVKPLAKLYVGSNGTNPLINVSQPVSRLVAKDTVFEKITDIYFGCASGTYAKGQSLESEMVFDHCEVTNAGTFNMDPNIEGVRARTTLTLDNGSTFVSTYSLSGPEGGANLSVTTNRVNVLNGSRLLANCFGMDMYWGGTASNLVTVGKDAVLGFARTVSEQSAARWSDACFDGGTLRPWMRYLEPTADPPVAKCAGLLFHRWDVIHVASGGMTLYSPANSYGYCFPAIYPDPASAGGKVAVKGGGAFAIPATALPISVSGNSTLVLAPRHFLNEDFGLTMNGNRLENNPRVSNAAISVEEGSSIRVFGYNQTLMDMTLPAAAISFSGTGGNMPLSSKYLYGEYDWRSNGLNTRLYDGDGAFTLMDGSMQATDSPQQIVHAQPLDLTRSFRVTFEYSNAPLHNRVVKGFVAYIHNDPRGVLAAGQGNMGLGYTTNGTATAAAYIDKSVGMMLYTWTDAKKGLYFCKNGFEDKSTRQTFPFDVGYYLQPDRIAPLVGTLEYDAAAKTFTYRLSAPYGKINAGSFWSSATGSFAWQGEHDVDVGRTVPADLSAICGSTGYLGFSTSADGGSGMQVQVANVSIRYLDELERPCADVAGNLALGAGKATLSAYGTDATAGYAMRELRYADGATLDVASTNLGFGVENTAFVGFDKWVGSGAVTKVGPGNLGMRAQGATAATLNLAEGGLVLRKDFEDKYVVNTNLNDWIAVNWRGKDKFAADTQYPMYTPAAEKGVYCGSGDTGRSGSTALKRKIKVSGKWRLSFDYEAQQSDGAYGAFVTFHNDPRGYAAATDRGVAAQEYAESYALISADASKNIKNCAAIQFYNYAESESTSSSNHRIKWWQSDANGTFSDKGATLDYTKADGDGNQQIYIANYDLKNKNQKVARKFHCEISYDDTQASPLTVRLTQTQGADGAEGPLRTWQKSYARDIPAAVGDDYCYFGLFFCSGGQTTRVKFKNLAFEHTDAAESNDESYFGRVNVSAPAATVYLDGAKETTYKLADAVSVTGSLTAKSLRAAGVLDLGAAAVADGATLAADGATVRIASPTGLAGKSNLAVANGGALLLDFAGSASVRSLTIDGKTHRMGSFDATTCSAIKGTGSLMVGHGLMLIVR